MKNAVLALLCLAGGCTAPSSSEVSADTAAISAPLSMTITSGIGGRCLDDKSSGTTFHNPVDIYTCNGTGAQKWTYTSGSALSVLGTMCLNINSDVQQPGTPVTVSACNDTDAQRWTFSGASIKSSKGLCLAVTNDVNANYTTVELATCKASDAGQTWHTSEGGAACAAGHVGYQNQCIASTRACTVTNGTGIQAFTGNGYGVCVPTSCHSGYSLAATSCVATGTPKKLTACTEITTPGNYVVENDLVLPSDVFGENCLDIHDVSNVNIDCQNHLITTTYGSAFGMTNAKSISVAHCSAAVPAGGAVTGSQLLTLTEADTVSFVGNSFGDGTSNCNYFSEVYDSTHVSWVNNNLTIQTQQQDTSYSTFVGNTIVSSGTDRVPR